MSEFKVNIRAHKVGRDVNIVSEKILVADSADEVWSIVDHWNENSDTAWFEILSIEAAS